jgi:hypothetical protein
MALDIMSAIYSQYEAIALGNGVADSVRLP